MIRERPACVIGLEIRRFSPLFSRRIQRVSNSPKMVTNLIVKSSNWSPKLTTLNWLYHQDFANFPLNHYYNESTSTGFNRSNPPLPPFPFS
ncbi:hypothetical protein TNCV_3504661 [Trichonephila clavipes]|uniref:Uncharacterized protein n=1 Tax=Trichonephila clavipes TaxID=2585209 RepID=A0A8X6S5W0_TRICX|nr:hypothetical protein TNCV_3504661 [Trichonephila clavipes]